MRYSNVCLEAFAHKLPGEIVSSDEIERRLEPLYRRLRLPRGRLELMTGIRERRFWLPGSLPSTHSVESAELAIEASAIDRRDIGALIHASVCRDHLEPATACHVHHRLGLREDCFVYDVSNACLGLLNGIVQIANMIELGQIRAGIVVGTEGGRELVENTIASLNRDESLSRNQVKRAVASLTIGSGSCAVLLVDRELSQTDNRLVAATARARTVFHDLCRSGRDEAVASGMQPLMLTDSERLMKEGVQTGVETFSHFMNDTGWSREDIDKTFCHQVGVAHQKLLFQELSLDANIDFTTVQWLGNTGAVALPITMSVGIEEGRLKSGDHVALLGIGSGINCLMLGVEWQKTQTTQRADANERGRQTPIDSPRSKLVVRRDEFADQVL